MVTETKGNQVKSKKRVQDHGEVFTNEREVNAMLDLVKQETERIDSRFLEPACGTGNFLIEVINRKMNIVMKIYRSNQLEFEKYTFLAVSSIYGIDILEDNVIECRIRIYDFVINLYKKQFKNTYSDEFLNVIKFLLEKNIIWGDALTGLAENSKKKEIIFSEWAFCFQYNVKRRDFSMKEILAFAPTEEIDEQLDLFSDIAPDKAISPEPFQESQPIHFMRVHYESNQSELQS